MIYNLLLLLFLTCISVVQLQFNSEDIAVILPREPYFPRSIPQEPGGGPDCSPCGRISTRKCSRRNRKMCVQPLVRYKKNGCSGSAEIVCRSTSTGALAMKYSSGRKYRTLGNTRTTARKSALVIKRSVKCTNGRWHSTDGYRINKVYCFIKKLISAQRLVPQKRQKQRRLKAQRLVPQKRRKQRQRKAQRLVPQKRQKQR
ncbi:hypothetical protein DICVIV_12537, partial [Dictyocaulus viviparus]